MTSPPPDRTTRFVLALHCHQPAGNFGWVLEEAYEKAYRPFLDVLERHPQIRVVFHYSGILLDWLEARRPEFLRRLRSLVRRGRAEFLGGGYYEPVLTMIPDRDALGQIERMRRRLRHLGLEAAREENAGAWLAERVWEPQLPSLLQAAGIRYTVVDDNHLALGGVPEEKRFGYCLAEDRGAWTALFPSSKVLRYQVPFKPVAEVLETLASWRSKEPRVAVLADDGEKFGLWPGTHQWVYEEGWLEAFFQALEANGRWLKVMLFRECLKELPPLGRAAVPPASYEEMAGWSGGSFRSFLLKYPESDTMHKKMLWISGRLERAASAAKRGAERARSLEEARSRLYMAQSNDAYWHGVFGGLYLQHLRRAVYGNLLAAERILDGLEERRGWVRGESIGIGGRPELLLRSGGLTLLVDPRQGGQLLEFSDKRAGVNLLDTLTRRPEPYHSKVQLRRPLAVPQGAAQGPLSIHEREPAEGSEELADSLVYDPYRRAGWIDHLLAPDSEASSFSRGGVEELGDFLQRPYEGRLLRSGGRVTAVLEREGRLRMEGADHPLRLKKAVALGPTEQKARFAYRLANGSARPLSFLLGSEINLGLKDAHVNRTGEAHGIRRFEVVDPALRLKVSWALGRPARLWYFPLETVSDSERGLERTYQGVSITFLWPVVLPPRGSWKVSWDIRLEKL